MLEQIFWTKELYIYNLSNYESWNYLNINSLIMIDSITELVKLSDKAVLDTSNLYIFSATDTGDSIEKIQIINLTFK